MMFKNENRIFFSLYSISSTLGDDGHQTSTTMIPCEFCHLPQASETLLRHQVCISTDLVQLKIEIFSSFEKKETFA